MICPVGLDDDYNTYNINADDAACAIAKAMRAEKLAFLTDIEGVYRDPEDPSTLISELRVSEARKLMNEGVYRRRHAAQAATTALTPLNTGFPGCISWTGGSPTVSCWRSLPTKESAQPF